MRKRVLITGITGYIGSCLARAMTADHEVFGLVRLPLHTEYIADFRERLQLIETDGSYESIRKALQAVKPDLVYHLAAYYTGAHGARETPELIAANISFGAYLLEAMAECGGALVFASTVMAHYKGEEYLPLNLYAATKRAFSDLLAYYTDAGLLRAATLVLSDTYGPGDHRPKILNLAKRAAAAGAAMDFSDGGQEYDVVHIDDVVRAFRMAGDRLLADETWKNEIFQVFSPHPLTLRQTVERMLEQKKAALNAEWGKRPPPDREIRKAIRLFPAVPGWEPEVSLDDGLRRF